LEAKAEARHTLGFGKLIDVSPSRIRILLLTIIEGWLPGPRLANPNLKALRNELPMDRAAVTCAIERIDCLASPLAAISSAAEIANCIIASSADIVDGGVDG
jgi:hypothetical protein